MYHQVATAMDTLRAALRIRFDAAASAQLDSWVEAEIGPWRGRLQARGTAAITDGLLALNARDPWVQTYRLEGRHAAALAKPPGLLQGVSPADAASIATRARLYQRFLASVATTAPLHVAVNLNDVPYGPADLPVFSFQKDRGSDAILLPDIDLLNDKYVRPSWLSLDARPFRRKTNTAIFVGSTTGGLIDAATLHTLPRLRAAAAFRENPRIRFLLPNVVQCADAQTEAAVRRLVKGDRPADWKQQFRHQFILSMDGNGATCSRVVVALKSNSVLAKYDSPRLLYYFHGLQAGTHYAAIHADPDVERHLDAARADPGRYAGIARAGSRFYRDFLTQPMVRHYMARLLAAYGQALPITGKGAG